jgi:hypothetical protein
MTLNQAITTVLKRVGLSTAAGELQDQARLYLGMVVAEVSPLANWWWLDRTATFATVNGTRTYTPISGNVAAWFSFVDQSNNRTLSIVGPDEYDALDLDRDDTGTVEAVFIGGLDSSTGYPTIELWRTPSAAATIRVRYRQDIGAWTSSNDSSELLALGIPRIMENVLIYGASALFMDEEGDEGSAAKEDARYSQVLSLALRQNSRQQGNRRYPPLRKRAADSELVLRVGTDTVTGA